MIAMALSLALAASAQPATRIEPRGAPALPTGAQSEAADAQLVMAAYGRCIVARSRRGVQRFLAVLPGSDDWQRLGSQLATADCLHNARLRFHASLFRGALFEALYRADYGRRHPRSFADVPALVYTAQDPATLNGDQRNWLSLQEFGDCVVRARPSEARALVLSRVTRADERRAFAALGPALPPCLRQGVQLAFSRPILRGLIAESLYRLSEAATGRSASGAER
ncbi:hypothetical protein [Allosphingosinicella sp.]|uniref:hypothetical protein n=1 Tax=Allosphingosinicella sp. TaxID=2823234 RepID=UPI002EE90DE2